MATSREVDLDTAAVLAATPDPVRWAGWLVAGVVTGLLIGFAMGLTKPRVKA